MLLCSYTFDFHTNSLLKLSFSNVLWNDYWDYSWHFCENDTFDFQVQNPKYPWVSMHALCEFDFDPSKERLGWLLSLTHKDTKIRLLHSTSASFFHSGACLFKHVLRTHPAMFLLTCTASLALFKDCYLLIALKMSCDRRLETIRMFMNVLSALLVLAW